MTQAQLDLQIESTNQVNDRPSKQIDKPNIPLLLKSILLLIIHMKYPLRRKKSYELMKDHVFLSSPIFPPTIPSKLSLSTTR